VLEGEVEFLLRGDRHRASPGTFLSVPPNVEHGFRPAGTAIRLLNFHTPHDGFIGRLRD
jgi:quercetin dioxygenase-like cupin family protein